VTAAPLPTRVRRDVRLWALIALFQLDCAKEMPDDVVPWLHESLKDLRDDPDGEDHGFSLPRDWSAAVEGKLEALEDTAEQLTTDDLLRRGIDLAYQAWQHREAADAAVGELTEDWPTYRQPVVDRSLLRLAHYEMAHDITPPKVVINEAVELAKVFSTKKSPLFINGVLDKILHALQGDEPDDEAAETPTSETPTA